MYIKRRIIAIVLIVAMIFSTKEFVTLADSISDVIESSERIEHIASVSEFEEEVNVDVIFSEEPEEDEENTDTIFSEEEIEETEESVSIHQDENDDIKISSASELEEEIDEIREEEAEEETETDTNTIMEKTEEIEISSASEIEVNEELVNLELEENEVFDIASISEININGDEINSDDENIEATYSDILKTENILVIATPDSIENINVSNLNLFGAGPIRYIWLGSYPQSSTDYDVVDPIKWRVLNQDETETLLISDRILDNKMYHDIWRDVYFYESWICNWFNNTFKVKAFSPTILSDVINYVGLPTFKQVKNYFEDDDNDRRAYGTTYAKSNGDSYVNWFNIWWLENSSSGSTKMRVIDGQLNSYSGDPPTSIRGVRPIIKIKSSFLDKSTSHITWDLDGGTFADDSTWKEFDEYVEGYEVKLPDSKNFTGGELLGWILNGNETNRVTAIPSTQTGDITLKAVWEKKPVTWDLGAGHFREGYATPSEYNIGMLLPDASDIIAAPGKTLDYWIIRENGKPDIDHATKIPETVTGEIVVVAVYKDAIYNITYNMDGGVWKPNAHNKSTRSYIERVVLPTEDDIEKIIGTDVYVFGGWWTKDGNMTNQWGTRVLAVDEYTGKDVEVYAMWKSTISFNANGHGSAPESIEIAGKQNVLLSSISETGFTFGGWYDGADTDHSNFVGYGSQTVLFTRTMTLYARWTENTYTITYIENGGTFVSGYNKPESRLYHEEVILPTGVNITKYGHNFVNWYDNSDFIGMGLMSIGPNVASDKVLYARWTTAIYDVNLITNGGTINDGDVTEYTYGVGATLPFDVTRDGYVFKGWWTENGTTSWGEQVTEIGVDEAGEKTYYARWALAHRVTFNLISGTPHPEVSDISNAPADVQNVEDGNKVVEPMINPSAPNFEFENWYSDPSFTTIYDFDTIVTGPLTIYAKWVDAVTYEVTFNLVSGTHPAEGNIYDVPDSQHIVSGGKVIKPVEPSTEGYEFINWYTDNTFTTIYDFNGAITGATTIYAKWKLLDFTLTFNTKGGTFVDGYTIPSSYNVTNASSVVLPTSEKITRSHYVFEGWYRTSDYVDARVNDLIGFIGNVTLYAKWRFEPGPVAYHIINFLSGGGDGSMSSQFALENEDTILNKNLFTRGGYTFEKWSSNDGRTFTDRQNIGRVTTDLILTATWTKDPTPEKEITGIIIKKKPNTLTYTVGSVLNPRGLVITAKYSDDTTEDIAYTTNNANLWTFDPNLNTRLTIKHSVVKVTYEGKSATFTITVKKNSGGDRPSGGGSSSGSSGSSSTYEIPVNYIDQVKTIAAIVDSKQVSWIYDPILNKFKMNITVGDVTVPAKYGCYIVNGVVEKNVNGIVTTSISNESYYFDKDGNMLTGWLETLPDGKWYFIEYIKNAREGQMIFGWYQIQGKWYYFTADGSMLENAVTPDGYLVGADGTWIEY